MTPVELLTQVYDRGFVSGQAACTRPHLDEEKTQRELTELLSNRLATTIRVIVRLKASFEAPEDLVTLEDWKKAAVSAAMAETEGNKTAAARRLAINVKTLYNMIERWTASINPDKAEA